MNSFPEKKMKRFAFMSTESVNKESSEIYWLHVNTCRISNALLIIRDYAWNIYYINWTTKMKMGRNEQYRYGLSAAIVTDSIHLDGLTICFTNKIGLTEILLFFLTQKLRPSKKNQNYRNRLQLNHPLLE